MAFLYSVPPAVLLLAALAVAIGLAGLGQSYVHATFRKQDFIAHNEVGGIIIAVSGTLYAVVLGFLTVVVWQHVLDARQIVVQESDADIDVWHSAAGLPDAARARVRSDMIEYANLMIEVEWPAMRRGTYDEKAAIIGMDAINVVATYKPLGAGDSNAQSQLLQMLTTMHDARQQRIAINREGVSWFEWVILIIGGSCIVMFCWLFGLSNARIQVLMTATVVTIIVSTLVLLFELQFPFRSSVGIGPDAWVGAVDHIHEMQTGPMMDMKM
jgi:hypothetical protein